MNKVNWLITENNITVNYDGQTHIVSRGDKLADRLVKAIKAKEWDEIPALVSAAKRIEQFSQGKFVVDNGRILVNGIEAPPVLGKKIVAFANEGLPFEPLVKFAAKLQTNPSYRAVQELFTFLEKNDHPITQDGNFIAYKRVRGNFKDIHSNTFDNSPGSTPSVPRNEVDEDCTRTCSKGLHVANWEYAHTQFASSDPATDIMLEVEVNPADVVAIPVDYNNAKMRVCFYKVLGVVDSEHSSDLQLRVVHDQGPEPECDEVCENCTCCDSSGEEKYSVCENRECDLDAGYYSLCDKCEEEDEEEEEDKYPWEDELD